MGVLSIAGGTPSPVSIVIPNLPFALKLVKNCSLSSCWLLHTGSGRVGSTAGSTSSSSVRPNMVLLGEQKNDDELSDYEKRALGWCRQS